MHEKQGQETVTKLTYIALVLSLTVAHDGSWMERSDSDSVEVFSDSGYSNQDTVHSPSTLKQTHKGHPGPWQANYFVFSAVQQIYSHATTSCAYWLPFAFFACFLFLSFFVCRNAKLSWTEVLFSKITTQPAKNGSSSST